MFYRILLAIAFLGFFALDVFVGNKPATTYDVALFALLTFCAISEKLDELHGKKKDK